MRQRSNINNLSNLNACTMNCSDSRLTPITRSLHISLYFSQAKIISYLSAILCSHLCCIRGILL